MAKQKQFGQLDVGDTFELTARLRLKVISTSHGEQGDSTIQVIPVPCGAKCPQTCDCQVHLVKPQHTVDLRLQKRRRVTYLGNLEKLKEQQKRIDEQIEQLSEKVNKEIPREHLESE